LVDKRTERVEDTPYDEGLFGVVSDRGAAMDALEDWLKQEFWNFNLGWNQFDGHSEGLCLLAGIDPEHSNSTVDQYGPVFLPSSRDGYGVTKISSENQWTIKESIDHYVDDLKSLGLKGRVHCHDAIRASVEKNLIPFWLDVARADSRCAKLLPSGLVYASRRSIPSENTKDEIPEADAPSDAYRVSAKEKADKRWENDDNKKLRAGLGSKILNELFNDDFRKCRAKNGRVMYSRIAKEVLSRMEEFAGYNGDSHDAKTSSHDLPEAKTIIQDLPATKTIIQDVKDFLNDRGIDIRKL